MGFHKTCISFGKCIFRLESHAPCIKHFNTKDEKLAMLHILGQYGFLLILMLTIMILRFRNG